MAEPSAPSPWGGGPHRRRPRWPWLIVAALALGALVLFLMSEFPERAGEREGQVRLVHGLLWLAVIGSALVLNWRLCPAAALRYAAVWIALGGVLLVGYSFRFEMLWLGERVLGELLPERGRVEGDTVILSARGGHFAVEAEVDGVPVRFLVDTGASDVVLSPADAERLGFELEGLNFTRPYSTANGVVYGAPVTLRRVTIGPISLANVRASVNRAPLKVSLLGMSFLGRLSGYRVEGGRLILRK